MYIFAKRIEEPIFLYLSVKMSHFYTKGIGYEG